MSVEEAIRNHEANDFAQHEEIRRLNVIQGQNIDSQGKSIDKLTLAMFGDGDEKGTKKKVDEMYEVIVAGGIVKKVLAWAFSTIMAVVGAAYLIYSFIKDVKEK